MLVGYYMLYVNVQSFIALMLLMVEKQEGHQPVVL